MDVSANKGLELNGRDAEILISSSTLRIHAKPREVALDEGLELNGGIRNSSIISRMVVEGYDTSPPREDVEEALKKHFASRGINLMHVSVPVDYKCRNRRRALIYVNGECEAEALKLDGSYVGGLVSKKKVTVIDEYRQHTLKVRGFDTSLSLNDIEKMLLRVFPGSDCFPLCDGSVLLYLRGHYAMDEALKLSGGSVEGFKFAVTEVLPETVIETGISLATVRSFGFRG
ncbi:BnaA01g06440D [Brassica napus]|uniref:BnaA01g06440D protein n=1 Tax=Brassica napus TaxID=3708 RepID=A0A078GNT8_BRANA|nr:BnaA01g06440D [Brassica napus]